MQLNDDENARLKHLDERQQKVMNELEQARVRVEQLQTIPLTTPAPSPIVIPKRRTLLPSDFDNGVLELQRELRSISPSLQLTP